MKKISFHVKNLVERKPIWIALSDLYLDTELQDYIYGSIARTILDSPYSMEEVKSIDKYEVFPVLKTNLISVAGEWNGFEEDRLVKSILDSIEKRKFYSESMINITFFLFGKMTKESWAKIDAAYHRLDL